MRFAVECRCVTVLNDLLAISARRLVLIWKIYHPHAKWSATFQYLNSELSDSPLLFL